jgi:hypothetical protein
MSQEQKPVGFSVLNDSGCAMPMLWVNHNTSDTPIQAWFLTNVGTGSAVTFGNLQIVARTGDYFTIMWTDAENNLYGTPYQFSAETSMNGGAVQFQVLNSPPVVKFFQDDEGEIGATEYIQYEVAP